VKKILLIISLVLLATPLAAFASSTNGTVSGYAWSAQIGWVNFGVSGGAATIADSGMAGSAWNENRGWITLHPSQSGVTVDANGNLSGSAWMQGTGWINFTGALVNSSGVFTGTTATGDNGVAINFSCSQCHVTTDYRPSNFRTSGSSSTSTTGGPGGGSGGIGSGASAQLLINNGNQSTNSRDVTLTIRGGSGNSSLDISNNSDFTGSVQDSYVSSRTWRLSDGDGKKTVYVKISGLGGFVQVSADIILDTAAPTITITSAKQSYYKDEQVLIEGTTESNSTLLFLVDNGSGYFTAHPNGTWSLNMGILSVGSHTADLTATDPAGNISQTQHIIFTVSNQATPFLQNIGGAIKDIFSPKPPPVVTVPKEAPLAFKLKENTIPQSPVEDFVFASLPKEVTGLTDKFPQLAQTFNKANVTQLGHLSKIRTVQLSLPTLSQSIARGTQLPVSKIPNAGIPVNQLTESAKLRIPSEILFIKDKSGLVDFNVALSLAPNTTNLQQKMETVSGEPLQFVVRAEKAVQKMTGYIVFKSRGPENTAPAASNPPTTAALAENPVTQQIQPVQPQKPDIKTVTETDLVVAQFDYENTGNGVYAATVKTPIPEGQYQIVTIIEYADKSVVRKELTMIMVVDPEGYVYKKTGELETRLSGATVSLFWLNPASNQYELWPAKDFQQENPQVTDERGTYSFLVPNGKYYLKVDESGFESYNGKPFDVNEGGGVHINIPLHPKYSFLGIDLDWKTVVLIVVILLLIYNFYRDKKHSKQQWNSTMQPQQ